ncbi:MAG: hypothetical protein J6Y19_12390 [Kiritimatiellae bacterium]|nr:hypothetical protein [Kiritimatiellia bacterium]
MTEFFRGPHGAWVMAAILALGTWYAVNAARGNSQVVTEIPVTVEVPEGWVLTKASTKTVNVEFRGAREDMRYLGRDLIKVTVDLRKSATNHVVREFRSGNVFAPGRAKAQGFRPESITVEMDREETRMVPVRLETQNMLPEGYEAGAATLTPAQVEVTGPAGRVSKVDAIGTAVLDLEGRTRSFHRKRMALAPGEELAGVTIEPKSVMLELPVEERLVEAEFELVPVRILGESGGARMEALPETATVRVKGSPEAVKKLTVDDILLFADATGVGDKGKRRTVEGHLPAGVGLAAVTPATVTVQAAP